MSKQSIKITILDDSRQKECDAGCGTDWSSAEAIVLASQQIKDRFGDKIQLSYLDLSKAVDNQDAPKWNEEIKNKNLSLPLLLINDHLRISGEFDIRQLIDTIEAEIEIGGY